METISDISKAFRKKKGLRRKVIEWVTIIPRSNTGIIEFMRTLSESEIQKIESRHKPGIKNTKGSQGKILHASNKE